jgi:DNA-binding transcriptional MerR regulator
MVALLRIGELANQSGLSVKAIRYYEQLGLVRACDRTEGNYRLFHPQSLSRLTFIRRLQGLGLSLGEIAECLGVYDRGELPCSRIRHKLEHHIEAIDRKVAELLLLRQELVTTLGEWQDHPTASDGEVICPNLEV